MAGELNLQTLLASMQAELVHGVYVFATLPDRQLPQGLSPRMMFQEAEGSTLILLQAEADAHGLAYEFPSRMITLNIHSSLDAVGFMARIASALAEHGMGVNPVAGFYHDHIFVPLGREQDALTVLRELSSR